MGRRTRPPVGIASHAACGTPECCGSGCGCGLSLQLRRSESFLGRIGGCGQGRSLVRVARASENRCPVVREGPGPAGAAVVGVFPGGAMGADFEAFSAAASAMRSDYEFAHVTDAALVSQAKGALLTLLTGPPFC